VHYYPVYLDLRGRPCAVLGGGALAEEKARGLLAAEAQVTVFAAEATPGLAELAAEGALRHVGRDYRNGDLAGFFLAIATVADPAVREAAWREAQARGVLLNTADDPPRCDFIAPSIVRRGDLTVAISTGGKAPALAVRLRQELESRLGEEHARFLELAGRVRKPLAERHLDFETRRDLWYRLVDSDVLDLLRTGEEKAARARFEEILGVAPDETETPAARDPETPTPCHPERSEGSGWGTQPSPHPQIPRCARDDNESVEAIASSQCVASGARR
jgi:siroheme synthase-like protein